MTDATVTPPPVFVPDPDPVDEIIHAARLALARLDADQLTHEQAIVAVQAKRAKLQAAFGVASPPPAPVPVAPPPPPLPNDATDFERVAREMAAEGA